MPIPFILGALAVVGGAVGIGKTCQAISDNSDAEAINKKANRMAKTAQNSASKARTACNLELQKLGETKLNILEAKIKPFIAEFDKIRNIELSKSSGIDELQKFRVTKQDIKELRELGDFAGSLLEGAAGGAFAGAATAFGAYSAAMTLGAASTGTAIATLSGVAATNATLAFLGGGAITAGGLGIAGGTAVLGGLVAAPFLAILGCSMASQASANLDEARSNLAKAKKYKEEMKTVASLCNGIKARTEQFEAAFEALDTRITPMVAKIKKITSTTGNDYRSYSSTQQRDLDYALSTAGAIKQLLDTPLLTKEGSLTQESADMLDELAYLMN